MLPIAIDAFDDNFLILHDNDPKHQSKYTKKWIANNIPCVVEIPPYTPEINPLEKFRPQ